MRSGILILVRMKSTRLPLKALRLIEGISVFEHLVKRLDLSKLSDTIVMCTSVNPQDDVLVDMAEKLRIEWFRGSEEDVLVRQRDAAVKYRIDFIISTSGDNPFTDSEYIDKMIEFFASNDKDYVEYKFLPIGVSPYGIKTTALKRVCEIKAEDNTEIWGPFFTECNEFNCGFITAEEMLRRPEIRLTIETYEDLDFVKAIFRERNVSIKMRHRGQIIRLPHLQSKIGLLIHTA